MAHSIKSFAKHQTPTTTGTVLMLAMNDFAPPGEWLDMSGFKVREISPDTFHIAMSFGIFQ